jgi:hypothetical protein
MMVQTVTGWSKEIMVMTLLYHEEERKLSKAEGSERVLCTASPVTWSRDRAYWDTAREVLIPTEEDTEKKKFKDLENIQNK